MMQCGKLSEPVRLAGCEEFLESWRSGTWDQGNQSGAARDDGVGPAVAEIIADVRRRGRSALLDWTLRLDGVSLESLEIPRSTLEAAAARVAPDIAASLAVAAERISGFAAQSLSGIGPFIDQVDIAALAQTAECWCPLARVGLYVPGGRAPYPSSVLMTAIPAKVAGVGEVLMVTPPRPDGAGVVAPAVAAAALLAGVDRAFALGGAQAVAALALGVGEVPRVDKVVGPGNAYVTEAKRQLSGEVGIDCLAGPSEVIAVGGRPESAWDLAAQLLAQAEHDPDALCIGVLLDGVDPKCVMEQLAHGLAGLPEERAETARAALAARGALVMACDVAGAAAIVREICPEHLWIDLGVGNDSFALAVARHAGAVFVGPRSPVAFGDYVAGPNHVLPTGGSARWASPLGPLDFVRRVSLVRLSETTAHDLAPHAARLARTEGFVAHARSFDKLTNSLEVLDK